MHIVLRLKYTKDYAELPLLIKDFSGMTSSPDIPSYSFHPMRLKLGG